jgi:plasmid rolling circle replication initiator protein Rep
MKTGDEVILAFAVIKKDDWHKVSFPNGAFAKAWEVGTIEEMLDQQKCKGWGAMVAISICRLANKLCPVAANLMKVKRDAEQPV